MIAIGDIHGCSQALDELLDVLHPEPDEHLVFIGDYIDRGPDSRGVSDRLLALERRQRCTFLRGNHEAMMLDFFEQGAFELWRRNGAASTIESYRDGDQIRIPEEHIDFLRRTRLYLDTPDFCFVHAGLKPEYTVAENLERFGEDVFLWERSHLEAAETAWEKPVVCGHTPQPEPIDRPLLICIDTGCVYHRHAGYGRLTAVRLPEREMVAVRCFC